MRPDQWIDGFQTVALSAWFLLAVYVFAMTRKTLDKVVKTQRSLNERIDGIEALHGLRSDVEDIAQLRRVAAALRAALAPNDNDKAAE